MKPDVVELGPRGEGRKAELSFPFPQFFTGSSNTCALFSKSSLNLRVLAFFMLATKELLFEI